MIYIASKYTSKDRVKKYKRDLQELGFEVSSSWMETDFPEVIDDERMMVEGKRDAEEVLNADLLIIDTFDESTTGGREVEMGIALANGADVVLVGPKRNIFHYLVEHFDSWDALLTAFKEPPPWTTPSNS